MDQLTLWTVIGGGCALAETARRVVYKPAKAVCNRVITAFGQLDDMASALGKNGGKSLADKIERVDQRTERMDDLVQVTSGRVDRLVDFWERPVYETDGEGRLTRPNEAMCKLVGLGADQLLGMGWVTLIAEGDRDRVLKEIGWARRDRRAYRVRGVIETATGARLDVLMAANPKADPHTGDVLAYFGQIEVQKVLEAKAS